MNGNVFDFGDVGDLCGETVDHDALEVLAIGGGGAGPSALHSSYSEIIKIPCTLYFFFHL